MATSTKQPTDRMQSEPLLASELERYDLVLAVIPSAFIIALFVGQLLSLPVRVSTLVAAVVAGLAVYDALFVHPPTGSDT